MEKKDYWHDIVMYMDENASIYLRVGGRNVVYPYYGYNNKEQVVGAARDLALGGMKILLAECGEETVTALYKRAICKHSELNSSDRVDYRSSREESQYQIETVCPDCGSVFIVNVDERRPGDGGDFSTYDYSVVCEVAS